MFFFSRPSTPLSFQGKEQFPVTLCSPRLVPRFYRKSISNNDPPIGPTLFSLIFYFFHSPLPLIQPQCAELIFSHAMPTSIELLSLTLTLKALHHDTDDVRYH